MITASEMRWPMQNAHTVHRCVQWYPLSAFFLCLPSPRPRELQKPADMIKQTSEKSGGLERCPQIHDGEICAHFQRGDSGICTQICLNFIAGKVLKLFNSFICKSWTQHLQALVEGGNGPSPLWYLTGIRRRRLKARHFSIWQTTLRLPGGDIHRL